MRDFGKFPMCAPLRWADAGFHHVQVENYGPQLRWKRLASHLRSRVYFALMGRVQDVFATRRDTANPAPRSFYT